MNKKSINAYIISGRIAQAIELLQAAVIRPSQYAVQTRLEQLRDNYLSMLTYLRQGVEDKEQERIILYMKRELLVISEKLYREEQKYVSSHKYYHTLKVREAQSAMSLEALLEELLQPALKEQNRSSFDHLVNFLFETLWTSETITNQQMGLLAQCDEYVRLTAVSALTLGLMQYWDLSKFSFLCHELEREDCSVDYRVRLVFALFLFLNHYRERLSLYREELSPLIDGVVQTPYFKETFLSIWMRYIYAMDTARVADIIQNNLPGLLKKVGPKLRDVMGDKEEIDLADLSESDDPELLSLEAKLRDFGMLEEEGADTMHVSFKDLKGDYFFSDLSAWFLPFDTEHGRVLRVLERNEAMRTMLPIFSQKLCDSDLYSFITTIDKMPMGGNLVVGGMPMDVANEALKDQIEEAKGRELDYERSILYATKKYVENYYRFCKIHPDREQFTDPFERHYTPDISFLYPHININLLLSEGALFLYKKRHYRDALSLFQALSKRETVDSTLFVRMAYCYYFEGEYAKAIMAFEHADLIQDVSLTARKKWARCYRHLGQTATAVTLYRDLLERYPEQEELLLELSALLIEEGAYADALPHLYKYEFTSSEPIKAQRPIAWCLLLSGDLERAYRYYEDIVHREAPLASDFLNAGYVACALKKNSEALVLFQKAAQKYLSQEKLFDEVTADLPLLESLLDRENLFVLLDGAVALTKKE